jgi:hypothetical protein
MRRFGLPRERLAWVVGALVLSTLAADSAVLAAREVPPLGMPISVAVDQNLVEEDQEARALRERQRQDAVRAMFERRAEAVMKRDRAAFLADVYRGDRGFVARQEQVFDSLGKLEFASWEYRLRDEGYTLSNLADWHRYQRLDDVALPVLTLHYQLKDYDKRPVVRRVVYTVVRRGTRWLIANDRDLQESTSSGTSVRRDPWENGPIVVARGPNGLVIGHDEGDVAAIQKEVASAVEHVSAHVGKAWGEKVVVILPADHEELEFVLENPDVPFKFAAIAHPEYTTLDDERRGQYAGSRVVIEPDEFNAASSFNRLLIRHELTHVALFERTGPLSPRWLVEGIADWVGNDGSDIPTARLAGALARQVDSEGVPNYLPLDSDFGYIGEAGVGYDSAWLLCRYVASRWGSAALLRLYDRMGNRTGLSRPGDKLGSELRAVLHTDEAALLKAWRPYVRAAVGGPDEVLAKPSSRYREIDAGGIDASDVARQHEVRTTALTEAGMDRGLIGLWLVGDEDSPDRMVLNTAVVTRDETGARRMPGLLATRYVGDDLGTPIPHGRLYVVGAEYKNRYYSSAIAIVRAGIVTYEIRILSSRGDPSAEVRALAAAQVRQVSAA